MTNTGFGLVCTEERTECTEEGGTRVLSGVYETRPCWRYRTIKKCTATTADTCQSIDPNRCHLEGQHCLETHTEHGVAYCVRMQKDYRCTKEESGIVVDPDQVVEGAHALVCSLCPNGDCTPVLGAENDELASSMAQLQMLKEIKGAQRNAENIPVHLFQGSVRHCSHKATSYTNCCTNSGWAKDLGMAGCSSDEQLLIEASQKGKCVYVGSECTSKIAGVCLVTKQKYCCYPNVLSRVIQQGGRSQLGKGFGSGTDPDCGGFTLEEIGRLDFSRINFDDFFTLEMTPRLEKTLKKDDTKLLQQSVGTMKMDPEGRKKTTQRASEEE